MVRRSYYDSQEEEVRAGAFCPTWTLIVALCWTRCVDRTSHAFRSMRSQGRDRQLVACRSGHYENSEMQNPISATAASSTNRYVNATTAKGAPGTFFPSG